MEESGNEKSKIAEKEEKILKFWEENKIFQKSLEKESPLGNFVFYDGPPFATGLPHYGHILASTIKDVIPRYKTMQGFNVRRTWGWDCHGLPIENMIEKEIGLATKKDIEEYGIQKFNKASRDSVLRYEEEWKKFIPRIGRWVDMDHSYKTMDASYTESVWWSFKNLFDKGLVYEGFKVMPYCPHCGTTLSNFEVNLGYKDINDLSVYVKFKLIDFPRAYFVAWTTTPWTLPGNTALAVGKDIEYVEAKVEGGEILVLAKEKVSLLGENVEIIATHKGSEMVGMKYEPLFEFYSKDENLKNRENGWKVYAGDFVNTEDGTGIVHMAPAFGSDDYELSQKEKLPFVQHVDMEGRMKPEIKGFEGMRVKPKSTDEKERFETDIEIIKYLQEHGNFFDKKKINHSYPHCWRCDTPLLNYATSSWFVKVTDLKEKLLKSNGEVKWTPEEIGENRFGKWLEGARDWAVSRSRYWGAPLPVWRNGGGKIFVLGSVADLKERTKKSGNKYFVMRHGEAEHNKLNIVSNDPNHPHHLTKEGKSQAIESAKKLKGEKIDLIYCSPFIRTKETAEIVAEEIGYPKEKIIFDDRVREVDFGDLDLKPFSDFLEYEEENMKDFADKLPNGESYQDAKNRSGDFIYSIDKENAGKNILIVTHGMLAEVMPAIVEGADAKRSKYFVDTVDPQVGEIYKYDFVPLPHNENYELDLHKPFIDEISLVDEDGNDLERIKEVFDTWYDSGSMPYAQNHYPFENKDEFEKNGSSLFPADFIAEGLDQTRGWFYTLLVLNAGLFDKSPYKNVLVNGIVLAEDGQKMSKKLKNYPDPMNIINKYGADTLRYYLLNSPVVRSEDLAFSEDGLDEVSKKLISRLENVLSFYLMYADLTDSKAHSNNVLDKWILSRLNEMGGEITKGLEKYRLDSATRPILDFADDFSTWYIKGSRDRFKSDNLTERQEALSTTRYVLFELSKYIAPFTPFFAEHIYQKVRTENDQESVHLDYWPKSGEIDEKLLNEMESVRSIVSWALKERQTKGIIVRQPLSSLTISGDLSQGLKDIIAEMVNVEDVKVGQDLYLDPSMTPELKQKGNIRELIRAVQDLRKQKNLTPDQKITLQVETDKEGEEFVKSGEVEIKKPTNISEFVFERNDGNDLEIENYKFKIQIR